ncbi:hypothetical protein CTI12_AA206600 [Artemisia annua]|uniref:Uncharacterized protein n=1 Tax=Artemisia annua TaxID=35608 RepID=A0A2U1P0R7_ARTAN|nr:hypothetical protein CTI12_AA206600 [Artemisia annua]
MLEEGSGAAVLVHTKSCETLECHTICNKSQRFVKISQDQKAFFKKKVKENAKKPLRQKHKARGETKTYVIEDEEGTDISGDNYDGILDHNLKLIHRRTYTFKDFLPESMDDSPAM